VSELQVEIPRLRAFGTRFHAFGAATVAATGQATRVDAGQTADMDGLLDIIAPAIHETAVVFGDHYDDLATVVASTGTALVKTADDYAKVDLAVARGMDKRAVSVGHQTDAPIGSGGAWAEHQVYGSCHGIDPDPAKRIRDGMDADVRAIDWVFHKFTGHHITEPIDTIVGNWTTLTARGESWADTSRMLKAHGDDVLTNTVNVDGVWPRSGSPCTSSASTCSRASSTTSRSARPRSRPPGGAVWARRSRPRSARRPWWRSTVPTRS